MHAIYLFGLVAVVGTAVYGRKLEIVELKLKVDSSKHHSHSLCSKKSLDTCQNKFQGHVRAVSSDKDATDKQDLWCEVLSAHNTCMEEIISVCRKEYPILSHKITKYLLQVVHKGCTHEGAPIDKTCADEKQYDGVDSKKDKTLQDIANNCLKHNSKLNPQLQTLVDLLNNLTRSIHHLYKRLPTD